MASSSHWTVGSLSNAIGGRLSGAISPDTPIKDFFVRAWPCRGESLLIPLVSAGPEQGQMTKVAVKKRKSVGGLVECDDGLDDTVPFIHVADLQKAALHLARITRDAFGGRLVGVTGSAGKTTTTAMIATILRAQGTTWATLHNNNLTPHVTTNVISLPPQNDYAVMELALSLDHRVSDASRLARPHVGVITTIGKGHIEAFASDLEPEQGVINEKLSIIDSIVEGGAVILPSGAKHFDQMLAYAQNAKNVTEILTCGVRADDDVRLLVTESSETGEHITLSAQGEEVTVFVPFLGPHMHINALLAAGAVIALGLPLSVIAEISNTSQTTTSLVTYDAHFDGKKVRVYNDSYNSTDVNVKAHVRMAGTKPGRKILILADIPRLAQLGDAIHEEVLPHIDEAGFEHVITVGPHLANVASKLSTSCSSYSNRFHALAKARELLNDGDTLFIKGNYASKFKDIMNLMERFAELKKVKQ